MSVKCGFIAQCCENKAMEMHARFYHHGEVWWDEACGTCLERGRRIDLYSAERDRFAAKYFKVYQIDDQSDAVSIECALHHLVEFFERILPRESAGVDA